MQFWELYMGHIKFQLILSMKNGVLRKNILALISRTISFSPFLILVSKNAKPVYIRIPFCLSNKHYALKFIGKMEGFTKEKYSFVIICKTRKLRSLFSLKDKTSNVSSVAHQGRWNCAEITSVKQDEMLL